MNICPSDIEFIIHCRCQGFEPHERFDAPAIQIAIEKFKAGGLISPYIHSVETRPKANCYTTTEKGAAWIEMLCKTPFPVQGWIDERDGSVIK